MTPAPLTIGRYQVTDRLGHGGMGTVYLARDPSLERFVAIKLMRNGFDNPELRERFVREARAVAALRHPFIVTLFEYGDHQGQPFIVMEYITGKTLAAIIAERTPMTLARRLQLLEDMCRGLEHAHKAGIIHRDIKPANIMVDGEGILKILDFGIAKQGHAGVTRITGLIGTPRYMSPEQISGKPVTRRSDIFAVGLVSYEILTLHPAFTGESDFAVMNAILSGELAPLTAHAPDLDPRVVRVVEKALERDPDRRYQDLSQMRRDVERIRLELVIAEPTSPSTIQAIPARPKVQQLEELAQRRAQQIAANLENAERAFELGDYGAAQAACEDVLIIDPHNARGLEGLQRAQAALAERQALAHLTTARQLFAIDEITQAEAALRAAFELVPSLREGLDLQAELGSARQKREQRSLALKVALDRAKIRFGEGAFESAIHAAEEALGYDPHDPEAQRLKSEAAAALEQQRVRVANRRAQAAIEEATRLAARDRYDEALAFLNNAMVASHPLVQDARARMERSRADFEQLKADAAARAETARKEAARLEAARAEAIRAEAARAQADARAQAVARAEAARVEAIRAEARRAEAAREAAAREAAAHAAAAREAAARDEAARAARAEKSATGSVSPDTVRLPRPDTHILVALQEPTRVQGSPGGPRVLSIDSPGFLPGPARKRRPKPPNRPVRFLDADGTDRGQARAFLGDQVFVAAKTGHDTVGFTASLSAHAVALALVAAAIVARPVLTPTPPSASLVMVTPAAPPPPVVEVPPPSAAKPRPVPQRAVDVPQTVVPTAPPPAPIEVPPALPTGDNSAPTLPVTPVEPIAPVVVAPPVPLTGNAVNASVTEVPVDDFDQEPQLIKRVQAKVPAGASGTVRVEVVVSSYGKVTRVRLLDPTPYAAAVTEAAAQCEFRPARRRGKAVMVFYQLNFKLETK